MNDKIWEFTQKYAVKKNILLSGDYTCEYTVDASGKIATIALFHKGDGGSLEAVTGLNFSSLIKSLNAGFALQIAETTPVGRYQTNEMSLSTTAK